MGGFECSTHRLKTGRRLDLIHATAHDHYLREDYSLLKEYGMLTVREGVRWHLIQPVPGRQDFSSVMPFIRTSQEMGIQVIWDLCHFGWPDHLDIFTPQWVDALEELARGFAGILRREASDVPLVAPMNEISFVSWAGGDTGYLNPFEQGRGHELKRQVVRAAVRASAVLRDELKNVQLVSPEPVIHVAGDPRKPGDVLQAEQYRSSMFEAWDMLTGRVHPDLGGNENFLQIVGVNFYDRNQWWNFGDTIRRGEPEYRPFREILREVYARYLRPLFVAETGTEDEARPGWFAYICEEVRAAIADGVPVQGICLYPILNHPGWDDDRHCHNGLWGYAAPDGSRPIFEPLAEEVRQQERIRTKS
jgi:beta-glucosidase/6-phospho-beta-glucosidase/beta-galactosidase